jgi:hypothetical protein
MGCGSSKAADAAAPVTVAVTAPVEAPTPGVTGGMDGACEIAKSGYPTSPTQCAPILEGRLEP